MSVSCRPADYIVSGCIDLGPATSLAEVQELLLLVQSRTYSDVLHVVHARGIIMSLLLQSWQAPDPVFYQTRWFYVLTGSCLATLLWIAHRLRLRVLTDRVRNLLAERLSERERVTRELNDTLLQGMQGLTLLFQGIAVQISPESPLRSKLETAIGQAEQLIIEGRDSIRDLNFPSVDLADALRSLNGEPRLREIGYSVEVTGRERGLQFLVCDEMFQIAHEAILNAFQHASANHVWVTLAYHRASLNLSVVDDGRGINNNSAAKDKSGQWGLVKMKDRASKLQGRIQIVNRVPCGTEVQLSVPAKVAYRAYGLLGAEWLSAVVDLFEGQDSRQ